MKSEEGEVMGMSHREGTEGLEMTLTLDGGTGEDDEFEPRAVCGPGGGFGRYC